KRDRRTRVVLLHDQAVEGRTPEHGTRQMQRSVLVQVRRTPVKHDPVRSGCPRKIPPWHNVFRVRLVGRRTTCSSGTGRSRCSRPAAERGREPAERAGKGDGQKGKTNI